MKKRVTYDQLSTVQWVTGFCRIMRDESNSKSKDCMLDYLIALLEDAQDFSWDVAKASHAVLLCRMEQGEIKSFQQVDKIDRVRRANVQRHVMNVPVSVGSKPKNKTDRKKTTTITIPHLGGSQLCPVTALLSMFEEIPAHKNSPLFMIKRKSCIATLTDSGARKHLKQVSQILGLRPSLTFHSFRRTGATWAFQHGVPLEHIKSHGTWASDSVYAYLHASVSVLSPVASAFKTALHQ